MSSYATKLLSVEYSQQTPYDDKSYVKASVEADDVCIKGIRDDILKMDKNLTVETIDNDAEFKYAPL